jgi:hypothetical protein
MAGFFDARRWPATIVAFVLALAPIARDTSANARGDDERAKAIVERADQVRFPSGGFEVSVAIETTGPSRDPELRKFRVLSKGNENTVVMATEPASERGQIMLMKGRDLWMFMPNVSQPIRLPLSQRLTGQVANGDLARANFTGDYKAHLLRTEMIEGMQMHLLDLAAIDRGVTYHRVLYWVRQDNFWPYKAEFYSASDRLLKTAYYRNFAKLGDRVRPTQLVMHDALRQGDVSVIEYSDLKPRDLPDRIFTKDYLKRLE